jgi:hypothetical protein
MERDGDASEMSNMKSQTKLNLIVIAVVIALVCVYVYWPR